MPARPGLDRERVVQAALDLVNQEGAAALTLNRLARELKVQPPSLYNHISGIDDLHQALAVRNTQMLAEHLTGAAIGQAGRAGLLAVAQAYRAYIKAYPGLYQSSLMASGNQSNPDPALAEAEARTVQVVLVMVHSFGVSGDDAIHAVRGLRALVHGFASLEAAGGFGLPLDLDESFQRLMELFIHGVAGSNNAPGV